MACSNLAKIENILGGLNLGNDSIYSYEFDCSQQLTEIEFRKTFLTGAQDDYIELLAYHHSIPVMDKEVSLFLDKIKHNGIIIDVGGCWGWHWRNIKKSRPDVTVVIVDFIRENLNYAKEILKDSINENVFLVNGNATKLKFEDAVFDGYWSVQTLQHVPGFKEAINEAHRVLKSGGVFANYSLNNQVFVKFIYNLLGREYHVAGWVPNSFYLARSSNQQKAQVEKIFKNKCVSRYSEVLFSPELGFTIPGNVDSRLGWLDKGLSTATKLFSWIARQQSFHTTKN